MKKSSTIITAPLRRVIKTKTEKDYKKIAEELWKLLDNIDSIPDMIHPNTELGHKKCWQMMVNTAEKRHKFLKTDGYNFM